LKAAIHEYEVRPRKDHRGFDLISDALPLALKPLFLLVLVLSEVSFASAQATPQQIRQAKVLAIYAPRPKTHKAGFPQGAASC
jgi:hypothetical protein